MISKAIIQDKSGRKCEIAVPRETFSSHGSELKTGNALEALFTSGMIFWHIPQKPVSKPTEKQLLSWLKATDNDIGPDESSIAGLVFMVVGARQLAVNSCNDCLQSGIVLVDVSWV